MQQKILIVEDSKTTAFAIAQALEHEVGISSVIAFTFKECEALLESKHERFMMALLDIRLPDAMEGEVVDFVLAMGIPSIVMTADYSEELRQRFENKHIIDYVIKDSKVGLDLLCSLVKRVKTNLNTLVLVVEDSKTYRTFASELLRKQQLKVITAENGEEALDMVKKFPALKMVITDYFMPLMDGLDLTIALRKIYPKDKLSIVLMSSIEDKKIPAKFLKLGANDFIYKPFTEDEFVTRISTGLELQHLIHENREKAEKDFLSGIYNRRYFTENGETLLRSARKKQTSTALAIIDIDRFKDINDTYGHDVGDVAIKALAELLDDYFGMSDLIARLGGEEFGVLLLDHNAQESEVIFNELRHAISKNAFWVSSGKELTYTVSIGVTTVLKPSLSAMYQDADRMLYEAKNSGRNRVKLFSHEA